MLVVPAVVFLSVLSFSDGRVLDESLGISPWLLAASETLSETEPGSGEDPEVGSGYQNLPSTKPAPVKDVTFAVNPVLQHTCRRDEAHGYVWPETVAPGVAEVSCIGEEDRENHMATRECGIVEMPEYGYSVAFWRGPDCTQCRVCRPATRSCKGENSYDMDWEDTPIGEVVEKPCDERLGLRGSRVKRRCVEYPPLGMAVWEVPDMSECVRAFTNSTDFQTAQLEQYFTMYLNSTLQWMKRNVCPPETTFQEDNRKGVFRWPLTLAGFPALADCPYGSILPSARLIRDLILDISLGVFEHLEIPIENYNGTSLTDSFLNALWASSLDNFVESEIYREGMEFFDSILNATNGGANYNRQRRVERPTRGIVVRRPEKESRHLDHFDTSDHSGHVEVETSNDSNPDNQNQELSSRNKVTWENFANVLLHLELLLRRASRTCVQNPDETVSWTEPLTWMCRSKDSAPFEDLYNILSDSARVEAFVSSIEHVTGDLGNIRTPDVELTLKMFETAHKVDQIYTPEIASTLIESISSLVGSSSDTLSLEEARRLILLINTIVDEAMTENMTSYSVVTDNVVVNIEKVEPQAFPGLAFVSLHNTSNLTDSSLSQGSGNSSLRDHIFQTIPGDLQETVGRINTDELSELIYIPRAVFHEIGVRAAMNENCSWGDSRDLHAIQFVLFENDRLFPSDTNVPNGFRNGTNSTESSADPTSTMQQEDKKKIGSRVLASKIQDRCVKNLTEPIVIILKHKMKGKTPTCVFWDFDAAGGVGAWSTEGCWVHRTDDDVTECHCNHLTNFALIMDISDQLGARPLPVVHRAALSWISWLGCGLSMTGLIGTLVALLFNRHLRQKKTTPCHVNLCAAMLLAMVSLQVGVKTTDSRVVCGVQAALIQYFLLVSLAWMAVEALLMYQNLVKVVLRTPPHFFLKACVSAWVGPAIVVAISASLRWDSYGTDDRCWISDAAVFFASFFAPAMLIVVFNGVIFGLVIRSLLVRKVPGDGFVSRRHDRVREARSAVGLMVLLGLTYLFGSFTVGEARLVFQYIFAVTNSIQGFLIFLFFAVIPIYRLNKSKKRRSDRGSKVAANRSSKMSVISNRVSSGRRKSSAKPTIGNFGEDNGAVRRSVFGLPLLEEADEELPKTESWSGKESHGNCRPAPSFGNEIRTANERGLEDLPAGFTSAAAKNDDQELHRNFSVCTTAESYCTRGLVFGNAFLKKAPRSTSESQVDLTLWENSEN